MKKYKLLCIAAVTAAILIGCQSNPAQSQSGTAIVETTKEVVNIDLKEVSEAVKKAYGDSYIPSVDFDKQTFQDVFGIKEDLYEEYLAQGPMMSVHVDNFVAVKGKEGNGEEIEKLLTQYRENLIQDTFQYPINQVKIQASQVIRYGDYVFFLMLSNPNEEPQFKDEAEELKFAEEGTQIAADVIAGFFQ